MLVYSHHTESVSRVDAEMNHLQIRAEARPTCLRARRSDVLRTTASLRRSHFYPSNKHVLQGSTHVCAGEQVRFSQIYFASRCNKLLPMKTHYFIQYFTSTPDYRSQQCRLAALLNQHKSWEPCYMSPVAHVGGPPNYTYTDKSYI